jgi:hypothetical protein
MQTYQYFIDDIQSAVYSPETADPDFLRDAAAQYAEACALANERLRQVGKLLRRGLRSEALQLTEEEPNLLDFVAMLDFPEAPAWQELLKHWGMATPPPLLIDLASEINQAYADQQPVASLLKQYRLFALARAPLSARIRTLRRIRKADGTNVAWEEDLRSLESARLKQMEREAEGFFRREELNSLGAIRGELEADEWMQEKPRLLIQNINRMYKNLAARMARIQLEQTERDLNAAHMAFDVEAGLKARQLWTEAAHVAELKPDEELSERAAPALDWLGEEENRQAEQNKRRHAITALEEALENDANAAELSRLFETAKIFDEPLTPALQHRTEQRLAAHALSAKRRYRIVLALIVSFVLVTGLSIAYVMFQQANRSKEANIVAQLSSMIDDGRLEDAQKYYDQVTETTSGMASSPDVQAQKMRLSDALTSEASRRADFESAASRAEQSPPSNPDRTALAKARELARTSPEKRRVEAVESAIAAEESRVEQEQNSAISQGLARFRDRLREIESSSGDDSQLTLKLLNNLNQDIEVATTSSPHANPAVIAQLKPLTTRIDSLKQSLALDTERLKAKQLLTQSIGDSAAYRSAIEAYATEFPQSLIGTRVDALNKEAPLWEGLVAWDEFLASTFQEMDKMTAQQARDALASGEKLEVKHGDIPLAEYFRSRKAYLQSVASREPANASPLIQELRKLMRDPLVGNLWMVQTDDGIRYYCRKKPTKSNGEVQFEYVAGFDLTEKRGTVAEEKTTYVDRAPQSKLASQVLEYLNQIPNRGWESSFARMLQNASADEHLEPILKVALLQRFLNTSIDGSTILKDSFSQYQQELEGGNIDLSVKWMDPWDKTADRERIRAEVLVNSLPPLADAIRLAATKYRTLSIPPECSYHWIGWLSSSADGNWSVISREPVTTSSDLVTIEKAPGATAAQITKIGDSVKGEVKISGAISSLLVEGRPVFLRIPLATVIGSP